MILFGTMEQSLNLDYHALWEHIESGFALGPCSLHGPKHWQRVEQFGLQLASSNGADITVVRLFAVLHDSKRFDDFEDAGHGLRGADHAQQLRHDWFEIDDERFKLLYEAIAYHADGETSDDVTIGTCWDADRLDLGRVGIAPSAKYLSTEAARKMIEAPTSYSKASYRLD